MNRILITTIFISSIFSNLFGAYYRLGNSAGSSFHRLEPKIEYFIETVNPNSNGVISVQPIYRVSDEFVLKNVIHIKTKNIISTDNIFNRIHLSSISAVLEKYNILKIRTPFLRENGTIPLSKNTFGIERIIEVYFETEIDPYEVCKELMQSPDIEYAVPVYKRFLYDFTPNDPNLSSQWFINNIQLPKAWDITKGDKSIVIAIVDSGVDWEHIDLSANIWTNPNEIPNNGVDDDGNGKVDDYRGWDFVGNVTIQELLSGIFREDNDPKNIQGFHGTHVAGLSSAVTNNGVGIASAGFSCSILPIKCSPDDGGMRIFRGYEGIVYASDLGAKIINCSWGGPGYSPAEQDIINYATNKGSLVVVASGNEGRLIDYGGDYPAGYNNVLCVGATNTSNAVASFSNVGIKVSVYCPGQRIYSTMPNNTYSNQDGTSMATPIVAGVAGLVASLHKDWSPKQILHQIRSTSDNVLVSNPNDRPYFYGKVNAYNAVYFNSPSRPSVPGLEIIDYSLARNSALGDFSPNGLTLKVKNFLGPAANASLRLIPMSNFISLSQDYFTLGNISSGSETIVNLSVTLLENNPWYLGNAYLLCTFESGSYTDYQIINLPVKVNSTTKLTQLVSLPDAYKPEWFGASSPQFNCLWAVGQGGMFDTYSGFLLLRSGTSYANYISSQPIYCIVGLSSTTALAGSGSQNQTTAYIYKTTNAGQSWTSINVSGITGFVNAIYFFDNNNGIFLGDPKNNNWGIGVTSDGGSTWQPVLGLPLPNGSETGLVNSTARWKDYLWFGTTTGRVFYSSNRGRNWYFANIPNAVMVVGLTFQDSLKGMAVYTESNSVNATQYLAITTDGGKSWLPRRYNFTQNGYFPVYLFTPDNSNLMYVLCAGGEIFGTSNLGDTWVPVLNEYTGKIDIGASILVNNSIIRLWQVGLGVSFLDFALVPAQVRKEIQLTSESILNYDTVNVGSNKLKFVSIKNVGNVPVAISAKIDTTAGSFSDEFKFFGSIVDSLAPLEEIAIKIRFLPKTKGERKAKLVIESDAQPSKIEVDLIGVGRIVGEVQDNYSTDKVILLTDPNSQLLEVVFSEPISSFAKMIFFDILGRKVKEYVLDNSLIQSNNILINISDLPKGIYFINIVFDKYEKVFKYIKLN